MVTLKLEQRKSCYQPDLFHNYILILRSFVSDSDLLMTDRIQTGNDSGKLKVMPRSEHTKRQKPAKLTYHDGRLDRRLRPTSTSKTEMLEEMFFNSRNPPDVAPWPADRLTDCFLSLVVTLSTLSECNQSVSRLPNAHA